jgi:hypothetical protein
MALGEAPPVEDQIVLRHLRERDVERSPRRRRQHDVVECAAWRDRLDRAATGGAEQTSEGNWRHASKVLSRQRTINRRADGAP